MNRVTSAIREGRAVLAFGAGTLNDGRVSAEISRLIGVPMVALGADPKPPIQALSEETIRACTVRGGGVLILLEPSASADGRALEELSKLLGRAPQKPRIFVVTRQFNPFALPMAMRMMKLEGMKSRVPDFMQQLPVVAAPAAAGAPGGGAPGAKKKKKASAPPAPKPVFVGREEELAALKPLLSQGGPLVLLGLAGVGRRWLVEKALADAAAEGASHTRVPDFTIQNGAEFDSLIARVAEITGSEALKTALSEKAKPADRIALAIEALADEKMAGTVMLVHGLHRVQGRDGSMYRNDRLGSLVEALLTSKYAARLVFSTHRKPLFFRTGQSANLEILEVGGLKGKELYEIFDAHHAAEVERSRMGPLHNHSDGHPMVARSYAIAWRDAQNADQRDAMWDSKKMPRLTGSAQALARYLSKRLEKLKGELRKALTLAAHAVEPVTGRELAELGVRRDQRIALQRRGWLEVLPFGEERLYYVHMMVASQLNRREISDFDTMEKRAGALMTAAENAEGVKKLALIQEANRLFTGCRRLRSRGRVPYPDQDAILESLRGLIRAKQPNPELARQRVTEVLRIDPANTDGWLLKGELLSNLRVQDEEMEKLYVEALEAAPLPELYHHHAGFLLRRRSNRGKAIAVLESAAKVYTEDARIRRRLARLHMLEGGMERAEALVREAMDLEPAMPDTYSLMGALYIAQGQERWQDAEDALREALRLDPEGAVHLVRLGSLQRLRGLVDVDNRATLWAEAREVLENAIKDNQRVMGAALELSWLLLDMNEDHARVEWLLSKRLHQQDNQRRVKLARARAMSRTGRHKDADAILQKLHRKDNMDYQVLAAMAELDFARNKVYRAADHLKQAVDVAPETAPERGFYGEELVRLQTLVTSGAALDIEKQAEAAAEAAAVAAAVAAEQGVRRDPGTTTLRRKGERGRHKNGEPVAEAAAEAVAAPEAAADAAPETVAAEAPVEAAASEAAVEAPVEAASEVAAPEAAAEAPVEAAEAPVEVAAPEATDASEAPAPEA